MDRLDPLKDQHRGQASSYPKGRPFPSSASPHTPGTETLPNSGPKGLRLEAHIRAALRVRDTYPILPAQQNNKVPKKTCRLFVN